MKIFCRRSCLVAMCCWPILFGCAKVGPDYSKPNLEPPAVWHALIGQGLSDETQNPELLSKWWTVLRDPLLDELIIRAIAANLDFEQARARLLEVRAKREISAAGLAPSVNVSGSATRIRSSESRGGGSESTLYSAGFDAGWELDLFGGTRRSVEAAEADIAASNEDLRDILVSLIAEVAQNYIDIRTYQTRLRIARENLVAQQETFDLTDARYRGGLTTELARQQARYLVASTKAAIPTLQTGLTQAENQLTVLLASPSGSLQEQLKQPQALPDLPDSVAVGIPADTLRHRPDVRGAERQLAAQTARIGVATAELYPSFKLSGSIGIDALSFGKLFNIGNRSTSFGPSVTLPIFDGGTIRGNIKLQNALQQELLAKYRATVLVALQEVENALTAYVQEQDRYQALTESADAAKNASVLAEMQYQAGLINFTIVLDAKRSMLSFEDQLAQSKGTMTVNLIRLYKALGGGWTSFIPETGTTNSE